MEREEYSHESFGQIRFSRCQGRNNFYGSELEQDHYVTLDVSHSKVERDLSQDWYFTYGPPVLSLRMSSGQFAELITSLNNGSGTPCTLEVIDGKKVARLPEQESRKEFVHRKFEDRMMEFSETIKDRQQKAKELIKKKTLSKQDIIDLNHHIEWLSAEIVSNIPFFAKCFQETMDEVVFEAKTEVENAIQHKINVLGLEKLHEQNKLIER